MFSVPPAVLQLFFFLQNDLTSRTPFRHSFWILLATSICPFPLMPIEGDRALENVLVQLLAPLLWVKYIFHTSTLCFTAWELQLFYISTLKKTRFNWQHAGFLITCIAVIFKQCDWLELSLWILLLLPFSSFIIFSLFFPLLITR